MERLNKKSGSIYQLSDVDQTWQECKEKTKKKYVVIHFYNILRGSHTIVAFLVIYNDD